MKSAPIYWGKEISLTLGGKCRLSRIGSKKLINTVFEGLDGVAVYHLTREPIPLINRSVKEMMFRFMRFKGFANNFTSVTSCVV